MNENQKYKFVNSTKIKAQIKYLALIIGAALLIPIGLFFVAYQINQFFNQNTLYFQSPIMFQTPVLIKQRPPSLQIKLNSTWISEAKAQNLPVYNAFYFPGLNPIEIDICQTFGKDCKMALSISWSENGTRQCDRYQVNRDKSIDYGIFQINSTHINKEWKLADLIDCHQNIQYAYQIFKSSGWYPWTVYKSGAYKKSPYLK